MYSNNKMLAVVSKFDYNFKVDFYLSDFCNGRPLTDKILSGSIVTSYIHI